MGLDNFPSGNDRSKAAPDALSQLLGEQQGQYQRVDISGAGSWNSSNYGPRPGYDSTGVKAQVSGSQFQTWSQPGNVPQTGTDINGAPPSNLQPPPGSEQYQSQYPNGVPGNTSGDGNGTPNTPGSDQTVQNQQQQTGQGGEKQAPLPSAPLGGGELPNSSSSGGSNKDLGVVTAGLAGGAGAWLFAGPVPKYLTRGADTVLASEGNLGARLVGTDSWLATKYPEIAKNFTKLQGPLDNISGANGPAAKAATWWKSNLVQPEAPVEAPAPTTPPATEPVATPPAAEVTTPPAAEVTTPPAAEATAPAAEATITPRAGSVVGESGAASTGTATGAAATETAAGTAATEAAATETAASTAARSTAAAEGVLGSTVAAETTAASTAMGRVGQFLGTPGAQTFLKGAAIAGGTVLADKITPGTDGYHLMEPGIAMALVAPGDTRTKLMIAGGSLLVGKLGNAIFPAADHSTIANFMRPGMMDTAMMTGAMFLPINPQAKMWAVGGAWAMGRLSNMDAIPAAGVSAGIGGLAYMAMETKNPALAVGIGAATFLGSRVMHWL